METVDGGACSGRLGREAGGVHKLEKRGRESLGQVTNVWDEVGGRGEGGILPGQPDLV